MKIHLSKSRIIELVVLAAIVGLGACLYFRNIQAIGYSNQYYTAAVKAMLQSWHNFFFVAAEPGGSVSLDKPPVGFWIEAISAYFLGVNGFAVVLPQIIAGLLSIIVLYHLVRRTFGPVAGSLAALVMAVAPVVVATTRNNTIDSTLILCLLLASWAFIKATESGKLRYLLLGAVLVGIGFNIKMLEAYLPLPAFYALYFLGGKERIWLKIKKLALASVILVIVSLSWAVIVDLTPASQRPYVGSSGDNSEMSLIFGYNGIERLLGNMWGNRGTGNFDSAKNQAIITAQSENESTSSSDSSNNGLTITENSASAFQMNVPAPSMGSNSAQPPLGTNGSEGNQPPQDSDGAAGNQRPQGNDGVNGGLPMAGRGFGGMQFGGGNAGMGGFTGIMDVGNPGVLRLFTAPLNKEMSWLFPFGIVCALVLFFRNKFHWPLDTSHQAFVQWGGWLLTTAVFFSIAGFFHQYYLVTLVPPLAALIGIGAVELWKLGQQKPWLAAGIFIVSAAGTITYQFYVAQYFLAKDWWFPLVIGLGTLGIIGLLVSCWLHRQKLMLTASMVLILALMMTPGIWSGLTTLSSSTNESIPSAYSGGQIGSGSEQSGLNVNETLIDYLQRNTQGMKYMLAVPSASEGESIVLATGRGVLYMGGFNGQDQVVTASDLQNLVAEGELRYVLGGENRSTSQESIISWLANSCKTVTLPTMTSELGNASMGLRMSGTLYDCKANS